MTASRSRLPRLALAAAALCLSAPVSLALAAPALGDTGSHGKENAPGQLAKAPVTAPVVGPVAPATVGPVAPTGMTTDQTATVSTAAAPATVSAPAPAAPLTSPQPLSNADQNAGGANNGGSCGAYCSTRDGSASLNGRGSGSAAGKPCAGCVGKADNKNPPGQAPNGTDANAGYECDRNSGVGKTNPAHTGCKSTPTCVVTATHTCAPPCVESATHSCTPPCFETATHSCTQPCVVTAANSCTITGGGGGPATGPATQKVAGPPIRGLTTVPATPLRGGHVGPGMPTLPFTGSDSGPLAQLGLGLGLIGGGLLLLGGAPRLAGRRLALRF